MVYESEKYLLVKDTQKKTFSFFRFNDQRPREITRCHQITKKAKDHNLSTEFISKQIKDSVLTYYLHLGFEERDVRSMLDLPPPLTGNT